MARDATGSLYSGLPSFCTIDRTTIYLNTAVDAAYYYRMWYWSTPAALAASTNETNFLTTRYPFLLEAACKHYAYAHREDSENASKWLQMMTSSIEVANGQYDQFQQSIQNEMYWDQA